MFSCAVALHVLYVILCYEILDGNTHIYEEFLLCEQFVYAVPFLMYDEMSLDSTYKYTAWDYHAILSANCDPTNIENLFHTCHKYISVSKLKRTHFYYTIKEISSKVTFSCTADT